MRKDYYEPNSFKEYRKFIEWQERRDEERQRRHEEKKKKDIVRKEVRAMTFAEGMIVAYVAQLILPPLWKAFAHNMGIQ